MLAPGRTVTLRQASTLATAALAIALAAVTAACSEGDGSGGDDDEEGAAPGAKEPSPTGEGKDDAGKAKQGPTAGTVTTTGPGGFATSVGKPVAFSCGDAAATLDSKNAIKVVVGESAIYVGFKQASSTNQNPVLARFDAGKRTWCRDDLEVTGDDGTGYGLGWDGGATLWAVFSSTGTQGTEAQDFRRFAKGTWQPSYGAGGGAKIAVLARVASSDGAPEKAVFLRATKSDGKANSLKVTGLSRKDGRIVIEANSWFSPLKADKTPFDCTGGSSPFRYTLELDTDLKGALAASAAAPCK